MKKRKIFKKITLAGLAACMFCLPILAGCAPAEMLPENPSSSQNFDLGLNPETDPVVFTTAGGLEIRMSNANKFTGTVVTTSNTGNSYTQDLTSFYYFTMGTFSGTIYTAKTLTDTYKVTNEPVNWLIIGRGEMPIADNTPAGSAIQGDAGKQEIAMGSSIYENLNLSAIPENVEIPKGCFLVLSERTLGQMYFNSTGAVNSGNIGGNANYHFVSSSGGAYGNRYRYKGDVQTITTGKQTWNNKTDGSLYTYINDLFSKNTSGTILKNGLGFSPEQANLIVPQQLYTYYSNGIGYDYQDTPSSDGGTYYTMFPLAWRAANASIYQNFCVEDYLTTNSRRIATLLGNSSTQCDWWFLRSGYAYSRADSVQAGFVHPGGALHGDVMTAAAMGVRPAMVMKLS